MNLKESVELKFYTKNLCTKNDDLGKAVEESVILRSSPSCTGWKKLDQG